VRPVIDHINRYVSDVTASVDFYTGVIGYELIGEGVKADGSRYAILKGVDHELFISEGPEGSATGGAFRHIGYTVDDVDALLARLKKDGIVDADREVVVKRYSRQLYLEDPDSGEIDLIQWTDKEGFYGDL
jgi:catechol 2,3-dioxygenase-like lactoylglutathione lyase family enzyme